jgi:predicted MFS family arabinose efflux permease
VEKFGRRQLFLWGTFLTGCCYIPMNVIAAQADGHVATGTGYTFVAFIFLYGITFSFCWTPLQSLYPAEIMPNDIRAQGMAFQNLASQVASFINTYATPVALQNIGWKTYTIFLVLHFVQLFAMWWSVVETKGRTLEELDEIFQHPHPVKKSLEKHIVVAVRGEGVKGLEDA